MKHHVEGTDKKQIKVKEKAGIAMTEAHDWFGKIRLALNCKKPNAFRIDDLTSIRVSDGSIRPTSWMLLFFVMITWIL